MTLSEFGTLPPCEACDHAVVVDGALMCELALDEQSTADAEDWAPAFCADARGTAACNWSFDASEPVCDALEEHAARDAKVGLAAFGIALALFFVAAAGNSARLPEPLGGVLRDFGMHAFTVAFIAAFGVAVALGVAKRRRERAHFDAVMRARALDQWRRMGGMPRFYPRLTSDGGPSRRRRSGVRVILGSWR